MAVLSTTPEPDAVIATFHAPDAIGLPIDYEHQNDRPEARQAARCRHRLGQDLKRTDGIWGAWNGPPPAEMIAKQEYPISALC